jgi:hypothetical protein
MLMCGICARVVSVEPNIIVAIALAIIAIFEMTVLSLVFADLLSLTEIATILTRVSSGPPCPIFVHSMSYREAVCNPASNLNLDRSC